MLYQIGLIVVGVVYVARTRKFDEFVALDLVLVLRAFGLI
jgi:hypothetical protein